MKITNPYGVSHSGSNPSAYFQPYIKEFNVSQHTPGQSALKYASLHCTPWPLEAGRAAA